MVSKSIDQLEKLFNEAGRAHHKSHLESGLDNPNWAQWYAAYLLEKLNEILDHSLTREQLGTRLIDLDKKYRSEKSNKQWPRFYAENF